MLKYFERENSCHIVITPFITVADIENLESLLEKKYNSWLIEFGRIYSLSLEMIELLYKAMFEEHKNIEISTHKNKLNSYLHKLGFRTNFVSWIKDDVLDIHNIELILIGGSANSSEKIMKIVEKANFDNLSLVIVQHVEAGKKGIFDKILQKFTSHKVSYASSGQKIKKSCIYLAPSDKHLKVDNGCFYLSDEEKFNFSKPSVSVSYESFSSYYKEKLLVIQECGYASDGVDKLESLRTNNSKIIIQDIDECEAKPMIQNALNIGVHHYVLTEENIINYINILNKEASDDIWIDYLLEMIFKMYNYDFRLYYRDMVKRRLDIFMIKHEIKSIKDAVGVILFNKSAFKGFFLELSINVTELFRKPNSFKQMIEFLEKSCKNKHNIKVWSAGCSSGEEVYSMAILLHSLDLFDKSLIYATDFNSVILEEAKNGIYTKESFDIAKNNFAKIGLNSKLEEYFSINDKFVVIDENIKKKTLFFQHNLVLDSSFNEFDIIICRNVIIYFDKDLQERVFQLLYDSLKFGGHLILGQSETIIPSFIEKFDKCGDNCKIFKKVA